MFDRICYVCSDDANQVELLKINLELANRFYPTKHKQVFWTHGTQFEGSHENIEVTPVVEHYVNSFDASLNVIPALASIFHTKSLYLSNRSMLLRQIDYALEGTDLEADFKTNSHKPWTQDGIEVSGICLLFNNDNIKALNQFQSQNSFVSFPNVLSHYHYAHGITLNPRLSLATQDSRADWLNTQWPTDLPELCGVQLDKWLNFPIIDLYLEIDKFCDLMYIDSYDRVYTQAPVNHTTAVDWNYSQVQGEINRLTHQVDASIRTIQRWINELG